MNQQWLTTLFTKGLQLGLQVEENIKLKTQEACSTVAKELEARGINFSLQDLSQLVEDYSPEASKSILRFGLNFATSFTGGMGLRISRLSDSQIEMVIPRSHHNTNTSGNIHEGAIITAAIEATKLLWQRHCHEGEVNIQFHESQVQLGKPITEECRIRMELPETLRENVLGQLRIMKQSEAQAILFLYDNKDQMLGEITIKLKFVYEPVIAGPKRV